MLICTIWIKLYEFCVNFYWKQKYLLQDPDDDDAPLQPDTFIKSIFDGIGKGSTNPEEREDEDKPEVISILFSYLSFDIEKLHLLFENRARLVD